MQGLRYRLTCVTPFLEEPRNENASPRSKKADGGVGAIQMLTRETLRYVLMMEDARNVRL